MKKSTLKVPAIAALLSLSLMTSYVFAEGNNQNNESENNNDNVRSTTTVQRESDSNRQEVNQEDGNNSGGETSDQQEADSETSLHDHFAQIPDVKTEVSIPSVDPASLVTYADVVTLLGQYKDTINQIKSKGDATDIASSTLSAQEKAILSKLSTKHSFELSRTSARADELLSQINDLMDALTPLGTQTISTELNLKNLLVSQLNDFSSSIKSLTDLVDTTSNILDAETN